jgi:hypothetical protein
MAVPVAIVLAANDASRARRRRNAQGAGYTQCRLPDSAEKSAPGRADGGSQPFGQATELVEHH